MKLFLFILICVIVVALSPSPAQNAPIDLVEDLKKIAELQGISGYEDEVRNFIASRAPKGIKTVTDNVGNLYATIGVGKPHLVFAATMDEVGYVVSEVTDAGFLRLHRTSNPPVPLFDQFHEGQLVAIQTVTGKVAGVIACLSIHLRRGAKETAEVFSLEDGYVDVGAKSKEQVRALGISLLDPVTISKTLTKLAKEHFAAPALADRACCLVLLAVLHSIEAIRLKGTVTFVWTAHDKLGKKGTDAAAEKLMADKVYLIGEGNKSASLYTGGPNWSTKDVQALNLPVRYKGTLVEVISLSDMKNLINAIDKIIRSEVGK